MRAGERLVARAAGCSRDAYSVTAVALNSQRLDARAAAVAGRARARAAAGRRVDVRAERALLGRVDAGGGERGGDARLERGAAPRRVVERGGEDARAARREQQDVAEREPRRGVLGGDDRRDRGDVLRRAAAEERERDVQRLGRDGAPDPGRRRRRAAARASRTVVGEVERDEEAERGARGAWRAPRLGGRTLRRSCAQQQRAEHVERDRRGAVADVGAAAREPHGALLGVGGAADREADGADRLLRRARRPGRRCR